MIDNLTFLKLEDKKKERNNTDNTFKMSII